MFSKAKILYKLFGIPGIVRAAGIRILKPRVRSFQQVIHFLKNKVGLEIGGPSTFFRRCSLFPVYPLVERVDNCNFNSDTIWEGRIHEGRTFQYSDGKEPGYQYVLEATNLFSTASNSYDFVLSCHLLEHVANPLKALLEWKRVVKPGGIVILPDGKFTFDHHRPVSTLSHLVEDHANATDERDLTHLSEVLELHDLTLDPSGLDFDALLRSARSRTSPSEPCINMCLIPVC